MRGKTMRNVSRHLLAAMTFVLAAVPAFAQGGGTSLAADSQGTSGAGIPMRSERGTLGVAIFTKYGVVIAADSRSSTGDHQFDDHANKVFQLSDTSACTISGIVRDQRRFFNTLMGFDFRGVIEKYAQQQGHSSGPYKINADADVLADRLSKDLSTMSFLGPEPSPLDDGETIGSLIVVGYSKTQAGPGIPEHPVLAGYKVNINTKVEVRSHSGRISTAYSAAQPTQIRSYLIIGEGAGFAIFTDGNDGLIKPTLEGTRPDWTFWPDWTDKAVTVNLQSIRANPAIKKYLQLKNNGNLESMTLEEAVDLANALISENIRVAGSELGIGGQVDIATITAEKGFSWVPGHSPDKKR